MRIHTQLIFGLIIFALLLTIQAPTIQVFAKPGRLKVGDTFPTIPLKSISKVPFNKRNTRGAVVVYDFSASWTHGASDALTFYKTLIKKYEKKGLQIVGINTDQEKGAALKHLKKIGPNYPVVYDKNHKFIKTIDPVGFPIVYITNKKGRVVEIVRDYCENEFDILEKKILKAFKK